MKIFHDLLGISLIGITISSFILTGYIMIKGTKDVYFNKNKKEK